MTLWHYIGPEGAAARPAVRFVEAATEPQQLELLEAVAEVGPRNRPRPTRARKLEAAGASVLNAKPEAPAKRAHVVRLYYTSMGGESLATEFGGLTEAEVASLATRRDAASWSVKRPRDTKCTGLDEGDALAAHYPAAVGTCAAETWCRCGGSGWVETPIPRVRRGVRVVVFPSEVPRGYEIVDDNTCAEDQAALG